MTAPSLPAALRAAAAGIYTLEAAAELVIAHGTWLTRDDFEVFIHRCGGAATIDWKPPSRPWTRAAFPAHPGRGGCYD